MKIISTHYGVNTLTNPEGLVLEKETKIEFLEYIGESSDLSEIPVENHPHYSSFFEGDFETAKNYLKQPINKDDYIVVIWIEGEHYFITEIEFLKLIREI